MPGYKMVLLVKPVRFARALAASALLLLSPLASLAAGITTTSAAGVYVARVAKADPSMTVSLGDDGTATVTGDLGNGAITTFGSWKGEGNQIKVTFDAAEEGGTQASPMVFALVHNELQAVSWNHSEWGNAQPPVMHKGYKVKYLLWSTPLH